MVRVAGGERAEEERDLPHACYVASARAHVWLRISLFFLSLDVVADRESRAVSGPQARRKP